MKGHGMASRLLRYFSVSSAIALALAIAALVVLYRHFAEGGIILLAERQNELLAHSVSEAIWPHFGRYLVSAEEIDADTLRARPETAEINKRLKMLAQDLPIIKVKVYTLLGRTVFSTEARDMGERMGSHVSDYLALRTEKPLTSLSKKEKFNSISGTVFRRVIAESYIPVQRKGAPPEAVFEMYADVTDLMDEVDSSATYFFVGLSISFGLLYLGLFLIVRRADTIIKSQYDELLRERSRLAASLDELHRAQGMIVRAARLSAIGTLTAGAAHEILNPANIIGLHGQRMLWENEEGSAGKKAGEVIVRNVERITRICNDLRRFSRDETPQQEPFDPNQTIQESLRPLESEMRLSSIQAEVDLPKGGQSVLGNRFQIQQVMVNLFKNAMQAMPAGGKLSISAEEVVEDGKRWWEVHVTDTGKGIPEEIMAQIFDPFFTTKPVDEGTGLGLSVSYGIVNSHGGKIWAESVPGEGATFIVRLPLKEERKEEVFT